MYMYVCGVCIYIYMYIMILVALPDSALASMRVHNRDLTHVIPWPSATWPRKIRSPWKWSWTVNFWSARATQESWSCQPHWNAILWSMCWWLTWKAALDVKSQLPKESKDKMALATACPFLGFWGMESVWLYGMTLPCSNPGRETWRAPKGTHQAGICSS